VNESAVLEKRRVERSKRVSLLLGVARQVFFEQTAMVSKTRREALDDNPFVLRARGAEFRQVMTIDEHHDPRDQPAKSESRYRLGSQAIARGLKNRLERQPGNRAVFVNRQSSSWRVGKPNSAKRAMPAFRSGKIHEGCLASFSNRSNFSKCGSISFLTGLAIA